MQLEFRLNHPPESLFFFPLPPYTFCEQKLLRDYWKERHYSRRVLQQAEKILYHLGWAYFQASITGSTGLIDVTMKVFYNMRVIQCLDFCRWLAAIELQWTM